MNGANWLPDRRYEFAHAAVDVARDGDLTRVVLSGDLDLSTVERVGRAIESACERPPAKVVVDLSAVEFVDSHGLQLLVTTHRALTTEGRPIAMVPPADGARRTFTLTGLDWLFRDEPPAGLPGPSS